MAAGPLFSFPTRVRGETCGVNDGAPRVAGSIEGGNRTVQTLRPARDGGWTVGLRDTLPGT